MPWPVVDLPQSVLIVGLAVFLGVLTWIACGRDRPRPQAVSDDFDQLRKKYEPVSRMCVSFFMAGFGLAVPLAIGRGVGSVGFIQCGALLAGATGLSSIYALLATSLSDDRRLRELIRYEHAYTPLRERSPMISIAIWLTLFFVGLACVAKLLLGT
jgi:hypothetical protein